MINAIEESIAMSKKDAAEFGEITFQNKDTKFLLTELKKHVKTARSF